MQTNGLDITRLKTDGSHYVAISFNLPYHLELPEDNYEVKVKLSDKEIIVQVILEHHKEQIDEMLKKPVDKYSDRFYSTVSAYVPLRFNDMSFHSNFRKVESVVFDKHEEFRKIGIHSVNRLILIYRHFTGDFHIRSITSLNDFSLAILFNENSPQNPTSHLKAYGKKYYTTESILRYTTDLPTLMIEKLKKKLLNITTVSLVNELLLNAYSFLDEGNFRLAIIEAETAFEVAIGHFLLDHYKGDTDKIQWLERQNSFTNLLNSNEAEVAFSSHSKSFKKNNQLYALWEKNVWKVRGSIVHGKTIDVPYPIAAKALKTIEEVLENLLERPRTKLRNYATYKIE